MPERMRRWLLGASAFALVVGTVATLRHLMPRAAAAETALAATTEAPAAVKVAPLAASRPAAPQAAAAPLADLDLVHVHLADDGATASAGKRVAKLTLDPRLQHAAERLMRAHRLPEAAIVMIDPQTGALLAYASHVQTGAARDICAEARAPSASVFKIVTATALVDHAHLGPDTRECYAGGGSQRIMSRDLVVDPRRDKWCVTLGSALGRSTNAVFARLALRDLTPSIVTDTARSYGYGGSPDFDVPVQVSTINVPTDSLGFARTSAGFWNSTLTPLQAALLSATVAHGGEQMRPFVVREVDEADGAKVWEATAPTGRRVTSPETASAVATMMEQTISAGTSYRAFHDARRTPYLPSGVIAAGKTGTLTDPDREHLYSWFTGFAPVHPKAGEKQVAIAVLVVNHPLWHVKANVVAREMLRDFFREGQSNARTQSRRRAHKRR